MNDDKSSEGSAEKFRTPEEVAAEDNLNQEPSLLNQPPKPATNNHRLRWPQGRKEWTVVLIVLALVIGGALMIFGGDKQPVAVFKKSKPAPAKPTTVASNLTGLPVKPEINKLPVTGVMIENSPLARPQSGLRSAGVVFEAIAEGGITRFLALYQDSAPIVGPIRSARPYYIHWLMGFDANYAHVGGSPRAQSAIKHWHVRDLDQFYNPGPYRRVNYREPPHNMYSSIGELIAHGVKKGYKESRYVGFERKKEDPRKKPQARVIDIAISGPSYNVHYVYSPSSNSYPRSVGGAPQIDAATKQRQLNPKVVIAMVMTYGLENDDHHSTYVTLSKGKAFIFQDGRVQVGQWSKPTKYRQIKFTDAKGKPLKLNAGQTWITAVGNSSAVKYKP